MTKRRALFAICFAIVLTACGLIVNDQGLPAGTPADGGADAPASDSSRDASRADGGADAPASDSGRDAGPVQSQCSFDGSVFAPDAANPANPCQVCELADGGGGWTNAVNGSTCGADSVCNGGACAPGCWIGGELFPPDASRSSGCEVCVPDASTSSWTNATGPASCPSGSFCNGGSCAVGCFGDGGFVAPDASDPGNGCQLCDSTATPPSWRNLTGTGCGNGGTCANGVCLGPPSCASGGSGLTTCGADGGDNCCASPEVTGGTYYQAYLYHADAAINESTPATVSDFRLDKYLVTVGRFRQFVNAVYPPDGGADGGADGGGGWLPSPGSGKHTHLRQGQGLVSVPDDAGAYEPGWDAGWDDNVDPTYLNLVNNCYGGGGPGIPTTWTASPGTAYGESLPIDCVNWYEAYAFCIWTARSADDRRMGIRRRGRSGAARVPLGRGAAWRRQHLRRVRLLFPERLRRRLGHVHGHVQHRSSRDGLPGGGGVRPARHGGRDAPVDAGLRDELRLPPTVHGLLGGDPVERPGGFKGSRWSTTVDSLAPLSNNESPAVWSSYDLGFRCARAP